MRALSEKVKKKYYDGLGWCHPPSLPCQLWSATNKIRKKKAKYREFFERFQNVNENTHL